MQSGQKEESTLGGKKRDYSLGYPTLAAAVYVTSEALVTIRAFYTTTAVIDCV